MKRQIKENGYTTERKRKKDIKRRDVKKKIESEGEKKK